MGEEIITYTQIYWLKLQDYGGILSVGKILSKNCIIMMCIVIVLLPLSHFLAPNSSDTKYTQRETIDKYLEERIVSKPFSFNGS